MATQLSLSAPKVIILNGKVVTTSQAVAEYFHKLHKNVLQKIESLDCSPKFTSANFSAHAENIRAGAVNRESKYYEMTKDGFIFLVMGFTGKKAAAFKEAYIAEFNRMERELNKPSREIAKTTTDERTPLRDAINMLVGKKGLLYPEAYSLVHQHFNVSHIDELNAEQLPTVVEYIHRLVIDGELLERELQSEDFADLRKVLRSALRIQELLCLLTELWPKFATPLHLPPMFAGNVTESYHLSGIIVDSLKAKLKPHQRPRLF